MSEHAVAQQQTTNTSKRILSNAVNFQRQAVNHDEPTALPELKIDTLSGDFAESRLGFDFSGVPAFTAMAEQARSLLRMQPMVQRFPKDGASGSFSCPTCSEAESEQISTDSEPKAEAAAPALEATPTPVPSEPTEEPAEEIVTAGELALPGLIVEDSITELSAGQMKKSEFLNQLRAEVCQAIEAALVDMGRMTEDCPYLNYWFDFYGQKKSKHIERAIHRYAPNASNITSATGYISVITRRARQAAETWARTGEITGVPEGVPTTVPGEAPAESGKGAVTASSPVMFKAREGGAKAADDPQAIQAELGDGRPLDSGVRSRMESAFETDFSHVRTHTDTKATGLSTRVNARAFTVGNHIAFGAGEYQPGTIIGDALIAHEMAHVIQQGGTTEAVILGGGSYNAVEEDADRTAVGVVASLWSDANGTLAKITKNTFPRLRSGLRLQRCQRSSSTSTSTATLPTVVVGNFRNSGSTSPENNCPNCPRALGIRTTDWKNGMELRGDITGHVSTAQYDFKRTKERGTWKKVGSTWTQLAHVPSGTNDDHSDRDEDLTPQNNHIYAEDIPGFRAGAPVSDASATEAVYKANFIEWVNAKEGTGSWTKRSNEFEWHSISWVEKVGGNWRRKAGENEIETGSTTVGTGNP